MIDVEYKNLNNKPQISSIFEFFKINTKNNIDILIDSYSVDEQLVIFAILNGYLQDKEIELFINQYTFIKNSSIRYIIKKLLLQFDATSRSKLFRKLLKTGFIYHIPKLIYNKTNYNLEYNVVVF
ncbi:MAG: hypothetical protein QG673_1684 [Pseudomonadota bacterium]|nr:hypothetical protein [Pseudomonadota bacterium]